MRSWTREERLRIRAAKRNQIQRPPAFRVIWAAKHAALRAWQRYRVSLSLGTIYRLSAQIADGHAELVALLPSGAIYRVEHRGLRLLAVYRADEELIVTFLTPAMVESCLGDTRRSAA